MTKIFEALQRAGNQPPEEREPVVEPRPGSGQRHATRLEGTLAELYHTLTPMFEEAGGDVVAFVAPTESVGASALLTRFAHVLAHQLKKSVLYVTVHGAPGLVAAHAEEGTLTDVAEERLSLEDVVRQVGDTTLFAATLSPHAMGNAVGGLRSLLETIRREFDVVLLDVPAADRSPDGLAVASLADGVILVVESERTRWQVAQAITTRIQNQGGNLLGVVVNKRRHHIPRFIYKRL